MKNSIRVLWGIVIVIFLLGFVWFCSSLNEKFAKVSITKVPETNLTIVEHETTYYEMDDVTVISYFYLMNGKDTLDHICCGYNPYINVCGLVYIPKKGIYDCRNEIREILPLKNDYGLEMSAVKNGVRIRLGHPFWNLKEMQWDSSKIVYYTYNLDTRTLSED